MKHYINKLADVIGRHYLILLLIVYMVCAAYLISYYRYNLNPDGISYITIAQKYAVGNFNDAVNGYWGPMISWLMVPFLWLGVEPLLSIKIVNYLIGILTLLLLWRLSGVLKLSLPVRRTILIPAVVYVSYFSNYTVSPDLLLSCTLLLYFIFIFRQGYTDSKVQGFVCGFWGGISYLVKSFAFPFFISHFLLMNLIHYLTHKSKNKRKIILVNFFWGLIVFTIISGLWITAISFKYKKLTISVSKDINLYEISPYSSSKDDLWYYKALYPPPNKTAVCVWEDPYFILGRLLVWRPYESLESFRYYLKVIKNNIISAARVLNRFSILSAFVFIAYLFFILYKPGRILNRPEILYPFLSLLLLVGGYCMIRLTERLIWPSLFLLLLMTGLVIDKLHQNTFFTRSRRILIYVIVIISFSILPIKKLSHRVLQEIRYPGITSPKSQLKQLKFIHSGDSIASYGNWAVMLRLSFFLEAQYYGLVKNTKDLYKYEIQYFFLWGKSPELHELSFPGYIRLAHTSAKHLTIYSLVDDKHSLGSVK